MEKIKGYKEPSFGRGGGGVVSPITRMTSGGRFDFEGNFNLILKTYK